jgi:spermidine synthase
MRENTFNRLFELMYEMNRDLTIVETGTIRFRDHAYGDGYSTLKFCAFLFNQGQSDFYTVDTQESCLSLSKTIVEETFNAIPERANFVESTGADFLKSFDKKIDVLYLDSANSEDITLEEYESAKHLLKEDSVVMIDDADRNNPKLNKWKKVVPQMEKDGWSVDTWEYQVILTRSNNDE